MIDPELETDLKKIENELSQMDKESTSIWRTLWRGCVYGAGYILGAVVIIVVVGWILNIIGVIPALSNQVGEFRAALEKIGGTVK
jgi:uncharacterized membrane protein YkgB